MVFGRLHCYARIRRSNLRADPFRLHRSGGKGRHMPYDTIKGLPSSVRDNLPKHAQEIYKEAFNSAWDEPCVPIMDETTCGRKLV